MSDQNDGAAASGNVNYFCYECSANVVLPRSSVLECPQCQGSFLEEITDENRDEMVNDPSYIFGQNQTGTAAVNDLNAFLSAFFANFADMAGEQEEGRQRGTRNRNNEGATNDYESGASTSAPANESEANVQNREPTRRPSGNQSSTRGNRSRDRTRRSSNSRAEANLPYSRVFDSDDDLTTLNTAGSVPSGLRLNLTDELLHGLIDNLMTQRPLVLNGNPNDYAWGPGGLDAILTQMMDQLEGGGPPPCRRETIDAIPSIKITADHIKNETDCSVCQERFQDKEKASSLPCNHLFHKDCIEPWLQLHNACPVCRKPIEGADDGGNQAPSTSNNIPPPTPRRGGGATGRGRAGGRRRSSSREEPDPSFFRNSNAYG